MPSLEEFIREHADGDLVPWRSQVEAAGRFSLTLAEAEGTILKMGLLPARYQRNRQMLTIDQQLRLFRSTVAVIGCGGLGGYIIEELARLGVGTIIAIDPDTFVEHNLNRQLFSSLRLLGQAKVEAAAARIAEINPAVTLIPLREAFTRDNGQELLRYAHVAVDALDSVSARLELADVCDALNIPFVHGAIGGWYGQVLTQLPGERTLEKLYAGREDGTGIEKRLGNPSFTPAVIASMEVAETCKILLGLGRQRKGRKLTINLLDMDVEEIFI
ncbi:HesA/MoeB/ThiF family protein [Geobacter pickeringii]|uniref:Thiamine biosynthesis protein ThiF n=1 Tax=Geobacter pickeringii TaxID=345632 RepID=A0A0B5BGA0_9BACT|nr:HesA/MoeB/ThiF family protein [Geobacter pickeringii]AJE03076.1 thiamine biosynthesis protein ThiF [Geobacter pickeringii]